MIDVAAQIAYWRAGAEEDWAVALELLEKGRPRHSLFMAHLALEKVLKAHVCRHINDLAPRIHSLDKLAGLAALSLSKEQAELLTDMNAFNIEGRYPEAMPTPTMDQAQGYITGAGEIFRWLISLL